MLRNSSVKSAGGGAFPRPLALAALLLSTALVPALVQAQVAPSQSSTAAAAGANSQTQQSTTGSRDGKKPRPGNPGRGAPRPPVIPASQGPPGREGHPPETYRGHNPHGSGNGAAIAGAAAIGAGAIVSEIVAHHHASPEKLAHDGPGVPEAFDMTGFVVKGLVYPNWPVVLDFSLDSPGAVQVDVTGADKSHYRVLLSNTPNRRGYAIFRLPANFGTRLQPAVYQIRSITPAGAAAPAGLRAYGLGAGEKAVGSVAIDQLTFQPATIHPEAKEVANYGFHAHSAFDAVRAEFIYTTLYNGSVLVEKDQEAQLSPIPEGEHAKGVWEGNGKAGEHMLQIRAWRGLPNGGDWVVAWSPDIVDVVR